MMLRVAFVLLALLKTAPAFAEPPQRLSLSGFQKRPKLVVVLVIDQFRADYLTRFEKRFLPAKRGDAVGGFRYLMQSGAYFPFANYNVYQAMTCPNHAMILTGAYPASNGISLNDWYDTKAARKVYCVDDAKFGISPKNLWNSTVSDEYKSAGHASRVVSLSLKDRAAVMLGGHRADIALWWDMSVNTWTTSKFYNNGVLPEWVKKQNEKHNSSSQTKYEWVSTEKTTGLTEPQGPFHKTLTTAKEILASPVGVEITIDTALAALQELKLGQGADTDFLMIGISSHDMQGHVTGPNAREMEELTIAEDKQLARLFNGIKSKVALSDAVIVLTGDHGIPPKMDYAKAAGFDSLRPSYEAITKKLNEGLTELFGKPKTKAKTNEWVMYAKHFHFYFYPEAIAKLDAEKFREACLKILEDEPGVLRWLFKSDILAELRRDLPPYSWQQLQQQFIVAQSGDLILFPKPFVMEVDYTVTHMTGYSYDTNVPLIIAGGRFQPGVYSQSAKIVDIAPTLAFVLGAIPPTGSEGRVLSEALMP